MIASVSVVYGCGGSTTGGAAKPVPRDQFVDAAISAVCDHIASCCTSSGYTYSRAGCASMLLPVYSGIASDTSIGYDANAAGKCIQALAASASSCRDMTGNGAACDNVFVGNRQPGAPCTDDNQCAAPAGGKAYCSTDSSGSQVCVAQGRGKAGDGCQETCTENQGGGTSCGGSGGGPGGATPGTATCYTNDGLYCNSSYVCAPLVPIGQSCAYGDGCVAAAYCDGSTCVARVPAGQPCPNSYSCVDSAWCNNSGVCANKQANGTPCQSSDECTSGHCEGTCKDDSIASSYLCDGAIPPPQPGGSGGASSGGGTAGGGTSSGSGGAPAP